MSESLSQSVTRVHKDRTWVNTMCASTCRKTRVSTCHLTRDSRCFIHVRAHACYTCEHVLPTRASTLLVVRARLLFKNVRPGQLKTQTLEMGVTQTLGCIFASLWSVTILHLETLTLALSPLANPLKLARSPCKREVSQLYMEVVAKHLKYHNFTWK